MSPTAARAAAITFFLLGGIVLILFISANGGIGLSLHAPAKSPLPDALPAVFRPPAPAIPAPVPPIPTGSIHVHELRRLIARKARNDLDHTRWAGSVTGLLSSVEEIGQGEIRLTIIDVDINGHRNESVFTEFKPTQRQRDLLAKADPGAMVTFTGESYQLDPRGGSAPWVILGEFSIRRSGREWTK